MIFILTLIPVVGIFSQSLLRISDNFLYLSPFVEKGLSNVCHQQPDKLINILGIHSLVCARCAGIYFGIFIVASVNLFLDSQKDPNIRILIYFSVPMLFDVIMTTVGIYSYSKTIAFSTGLLFGSVGFLYFYNGLKKLYTEIYTKR